MSEVCCGKECGKKELVGLNAYRFSDSPEYLDSPDTMLYGDALFGNLSVVNFLLS